MHGLTRAGLRVGACRITGTGAGGDPYLYRDAGADEVLDFTDDGLVTTYRVPVEQLVGTAVRLHAHLAGRDVDAIAMEIADGVLQPQTAALLAAPQVQALTDAVLFAAGDAAGALLGVERVRRAGLPVLAVSGLLTASPLATREAQACLDVLARDLAARLAGTGAAAEIARVHVVRGRFHLDRCFEHHRTLGRERVLATAELPG